jgi:hypothetical protein
MYKSCLNEDLEGDGAGIWSQRCCYTLQNKAAWCVPMKKAFLFKERNKSKQKEFMEFMEFIAKERVKNLVFVDESAQITETSRKLLGRERS